MTADEVAPSVPLYFPASQSLHRTPSGENFPDVHFEQLDNPELGASKPAGHCLHVDGEE